MNLEERNKSTPFKGSKLLLTSQSNPAFFKNPYAKSISMAPIEEEIKEFKEEISSTFNIAKK